MTTLALLCPWCRSGNPPRSNCVNCGGTLPMQSRGERGVAPSPAPRLIPAIYRRRVLYTRNVLVIIGMVFTIPFFWTLIFPAIGIPMWIHGRRSALRKLAALERGKPVEGELTEIFKDTSIKINGDSPWKLVYRFMSASGRTHEGWVHGWDSAHIDRQARDPVWVVYLSEDATINCLWPPVS